MDIVEAIEIFALVTGLLYVVLEIAQRNSMWVVGILTGAACAYSFAVQHLWASMGLNLYYVGVSVWGLWVWRRDSARLKSRAPEEDGGGGGPATIHLGRLGWRTVAVSSAVLVAGTAALAILLKALGDPSTLLDSLVAVMSAIGTWWLARSYPQQWVVWIAADILSAVLCVGSGLYWMCGLYALYTLSAVYGLYHWTRHGAYLD